MLAITKASLQSMLRSPSAIIFSLAFPIIFILVFGFIGRNGNIVLDVALAENCDINNPIYATLNKMDMVKFVSGTTEEKKSALLKGKIDAILNIEPGADSLSRYKVTIQTSSASIQNGQIFKSMLNEVIANMNMAQMTHMQRLATINMPPPVQARVYQTIDFILPGQIGFSMLSAGVFGAAFVFFSLRQTLVIKRFFATPVSKGSIIIGEMLSRLTFQMVAAAIIILMGRFLFHFTLVHGAATFFQMMFLCAFGLIVFMGFGFIVSGLAKSEASIPPFANLITLPQFLLAGTFFSVEVFPAWLKPISKALPLTYMNEAMRKIAFDGANLWDVKYQLGVMLIWGIVVYVIAVRTFKWE